MYRGWRYYETSVVSEPTAFDILQEAIRAVAVAQQQYEAAIIRRAEAEKRFQEFAQRTINSPCERS